MFWGQCESVLLQFSTYGLLTYLNCLFLFQYLLVECICYRSFCIFSSTTLRAECAATLLENGASVNATDQDGQTALHWAVDREDLSLVQLLLARKADVNAADALKHTALHRAAALGSLRIARALLERGADVNLKNANGWTPVCIVVDR